MKKEKRPLEPTLVFQGRLAPVALSSALAFAGGGASVYYTLDSPYPAIIQAPKNITIQACFTPKNECQPLLIKAISESKKNIYMQNYSFTSQPVAQALIAAYKRGIDIKVISDKGQLHKRSAILSLLKENIPVYLDQKVAIAHNKVIIIDHHYVITGSYNFSKGAEKKNAENLLMIGSPDLAQQYLDNWKERQQESTRCMNHTPYLN